MGPLTESKFLYEDFSDVVNNVIKKEVFEVVNEYNIVFKLVAESEMKNIE